MDNFVFWIFIFRSQFEVCICLQKFGGSRPAGLAVKGIRTNSSKRLSQIIIVYLDYLLVTFKSVYINNTSIKSHIQFVSSAPSTFHPVGVDDVTKFYEYFSATYGADCEDPYPSLSDFHDYEPNLEFDDSDLLQQKHPENDDGKMIPNLIFKIEAIQDDNAGFYVDFDLPEVDRHGSGTPNDYIESPMSDGTIEEDFEKALAREIAADRRLSNDHCSGAGNLTLEGTSIEDDDYSDIARHGIVEVVGDDVAGRKIIVIAACRLPSNKTFDYNR
jgi:hypothetical protein